MTHLKMKVLFSISDRIELCKLDSIHVLKIQYDTFSALISLHGGQLLSFKPKNQKDLIWLSNQAIFDGKSAIRGGVPICFPWFGSSPKFHQTHGFARNISWDYCSHKERTNGIEVTLLLESDASTLKMWPHRFRNLLTFKFTDKVTISLEVENTSDEEWLFSGALHTYLSVKNINRVSVSGIGNSYLDGVQDYTQFDGDNEISIDRETIRVCTNPEKEITLTDPENDRKILVINHGNNAAVIWNPWEETTQKMDDMPNEDYTKMLCIESAIFNKNPIILAPSSSHTLETTLIFSE